MNENYTNITQCLLIKHVSINYNSKKLIKQFLGSRMKKGKHIKERKYLVSDGSVILYQSNPLLILNTGSFKSTEDAS